MPCPLVPRYRIAYDWGIAFLVCAATQALYNALVIGANYVGMTPVS
ncbi:MAG: hypothetical protein IT494_07375 [Gammaproteobacteria bacterium]|nr:hypothetical protein [Gammaproteobacteria bacterium]